MRVRHCSNLNCENTKSFSNDPEDPSAAALKVRLKVFVFKFLVVIREVLQVRHFWLLHRRRQRVR